MGTKLCNPASASRRHSLVNAPVLVRGKVKVSASVPRSVERSPLHCSLRCCARPFPECALSFPHVHHAYGAVGSRRTFATCTGTHSCTGHNVDMDDIRSCRDRGWLYLLRCVQRWLPRSMVRGLVIQPGVCHQTVVGLVLTQKGSDDACILSLISRYPHGGVVILDHS